MAKSCKYYRYRKYVSYDGGATYERTSEYQLGYIYEVDSEECTSGSSQYERWVEGWMCDDCESKKIIGNLSDSTYSYDCDSSTELTSNDVDKTTVSAEVGDCITSIGYAAFENCLDLTSVSLPSTITSIGSKAFYNCENLFEIGIPENVTSIGDYAFFHCIQMRNVYLPETLASLGESAFEQCMNFDTINIPSSLAFIPNKCFYLAAGLSSLEIPTSITSIGNEAFAYCVNLYYIVFYSTTPPKLGKNVFDNTNENFKIFVPSESVNTYKTSTNWSEYADKIYSN